jgi:hypothetical protein
MTMTIMTTRLGADRLDVPPLPRRPGRRPDEAVLIRRLREFELFEAHSIPRKGNVRVLSVRREPIDAVDQFVD